MAIDFTLENHGTIVLLTPMTDDAKEWAFDHLPADAPRWCDSIAIEPRYIADILAGIHDAGLSTEG